MATLEELQLLKDQYSGLKNDISALLANMRVSLSSTNISTSEEINKSSILAGISNSNMNLGTDPNLDSADGVPCYYTEPINASKIPVGLKTRSQSDPNTIITGTNENQCCVKCLFKFDAKYLSMPENSFSIPLNNQSIIPIKHTGGVYPKELILVGKNNPQDIIVYRNLNFGLGICRGNENGNLLLLRDRDNPDFTKYKSLWISKSGYNLSYVDSYSKRLVLVMPDEEYCYELLDSWWTLYMTYSTTAPSTTTNEFMRTTASYTTSGTELDLVGISSGNTSTLPSDTAWRSICYGNDKYVTISYNSNLSAYSTDGITWIQSTSSSSQDWSSVCYGNGKYVSVANSSNISAYSTDGITWTQTTLPISKSWQSVCYGNGKFVTVASNTNISAYSTDGITWTSSTMPSSQSWWSVCYGNGKYVAVGNGSNASAYSIDGITWTSSTLPSNTFWQSVCYDNGKYVAVSSTNISAYSTDGITWTQTTLPSTGNWWSVCYGNGKYVAIVYNSNKSAYSTDGINWTETTLPSSHPWFAVCYGNGKFVTVAQNSTMSAYSTDGITWTNFNTSNIINPISQNNKICSRPNTGDTTSYFKTSVKLNSTNINAVPSSSATSLTEFATSNPNSNIMWAGLSSPANTILTQSINMSDFKQITLNALITHVLDVKMKNGIIYVLGTNSSTGNLYLQKISESSNVISSAIQNTVLSTSFINNYGKIIFSAETFITIGTITHVNSKLVSTLYKVKETNTAFARQSYATVTHTLTTTLDATRGIRDSVIIPVFTNANAYKVIMFTNGYNTTTTTVNGQYASVFDTILSGISITTPSGTKLLNNSGITTTSSTYIHYKYTPASNIADASITIYTATGKYTYASGAWTIDNTVKTIADLGSVNTTVATTNSLVTAYGMIPNIMFHCTSTGTLMYFNKRIQYQ